MQYLRDIPTRQRLNLFRPFNRHIVGTGEHGSGWPFAMDSLSPLFGDSGILLDDFAEHTFIYGGDTVLHQEPWIGIFHHPPEMPAFALPGHRPQEIFMSSAWRQSAPYLQLAISLSTHLAQYLQTILPSPVATVKHPTDTPAIKFTMESFVRNPQPRLIQAGWYLRNTQAIYQVESPSWISKTLIANNANWVRDYDHRVQLFWKAKRSRINTGQVQIIRRVPDNVYDHLLSQNVVLAEYFDVSASNLIIECVSRNTPIVVNRHPAIEEYLGSDYPLLYDDIRQVPDLLEKRRIGEANEYLAATSRPWLDGENFRTQIFQLVGQLAAQ